MRNVKRNRVVVPAALAAATAFFAGGSVARAQDAFVKYYTATAQGIGGFAPSGNDFYHANFSPNAGFAKYSFSGTWTGTTYVGATDMQTFEQSLSVAGSGSLPTTPSGGLPVVGGIVLNPTTLTINRVGVGPVIYAPGTLGFVIDSPTNVLSGTTTRYDLTKVGYFYDLRQVGAAVGGGVDRNANGTAEWNDVFEPLFSKADMRTVAGYAGTTSPNTSRHFAYSTDGQSVYFVDSSNANITGGLWKVNLTGTGSTALSRILTATNGITVEPTVVSSSVRDFGGGSGDQIVVIGSAEYAPNPNAGGISYVVDNGTSVSAAKTLLSQKQLQGFLETSAVPNTQATGSDSSGNVYFYNAGEGGVFKYDVNGRLSKVFSRPEQIAFDTAVAGGTSSTVTVTDMKFRTVSYTGPGGPFNVGQLLYADSTTAVRAGVGVNLFTPGDFDRDNDVDATDIAAFKTKLGLRGVVVASVGTTSPFTQVNGTNLKYDLNGSSTTASVSGVAIDWKDVKIFQQYAGLSDGDVNMDFAVDSTDLATLGANYTGTAKLFTQGNLTSVRIANTDKDDVNYADLVTLAANWTGAKPSVAAVGSISAAEIDRAFAITSNGTINQYTAKGSSNWSTNASWATGAYPDAAGAVANLLTKPSDDVSLNVDGSYTVGQLNFDNYFSYTLNGTGTLHLSGNGANAEINTFAASPVISANLAVDTATDVTVMYSADTLTMSGTLSGNGTSLNKKGPGTVAITGPISYTGQTNINGGTLIIDSTGGNRTVNNIGGAGGNLVKNGANKLSAFSVDMGGNVTINAGKLEIRARVGSPRISNNHPMYVSSLTIAAGQTLDLNDNDLVVGSGSFSTLQALVLAGYSPGPDTTKTGIISSTSQTVDNGATILALFDNSLAGFTDFPVGSGHTLSPSAIVGKYTYIGDTNMDGQVTPQDYTATDSNLGTSVNVAISWFYGDTNFDGNIDPTDYAGIDGALGLGQGNPLAAAGAAAVPEPSIATGLLAAGILSLRRRRRHL
jgi:autotransporter-associated beta strand protein